MVIIKLGMMAGISKLSLMHTKWVLIINKKSKVICGKLVNSVLKNKQIDNRRVYLNFF